MAVAVGTDQMVQALGEALRRVEAGWTQGAYWRSATGGDCEPEQARRVDLAYALKAAAELYGLDPEELRTFVTAQLGEPYRSDRHLGLERFNDSRFRTRGEIRMVLRRAIEAA